MAGAGDWRTSLYLSTGVALWSWRPHFVYGAWKQREYLRPVIEEDTATSSVAIANISREIAETDLRLIGVTTTNVYRRDEFRVVGKALARKLKGASGAVESVEAFFEEAPTRLYSTKTANMFVLQRGLDDPSHMYGWCDLPWGVDGVYVQLQDLQPGFASIHVTYVPSAPLEEVAAQAVADVRPNSLKWRVTSDDFSLTGPSGAIGAEIRSRIGREVKRLVQHGLLPQGRGLITRDTYPAGLAMYWSMHHADPERSRLLRDVLGVSGYDFWGSQDFYLFEEVEPRAGIAAGNLTWLVMSQTAGAENPSVPLRLLEAQLSVLPWLSVWRGLQQMLIGQQAAQATLAALSWKWPGAIRRWRLWRLARMLLILRFRTAELRAFVDGAKDHHNLDQGAVRFFGGLNHRAIGRMPGPSLDLRQYIESLKASASGVINSAHAGAELSAEAASELLTIRAAATMQAATLATMFISILALVVAIVSVWLSLTFSH